VIKSVRPDRRDAVVVLSRHDHKSIRPSEEVRETLKGLWRIALGILLAHAIQQRKVELNRIDNGRFTSSAF
jgi:hypothetical protein